MKVAIIDPSAWSLNYDIPLAVELQNAGCEVTLYAPVSLRPTTEVPSEVQVNRIFEAIRIAGMQPSRIRRALHHVWAMVLLAAKLAFDDTTVVHVQWMPLRRFDQLVWRLVGRRKPVVFTVHNSQERDGAYSGESLHQFAAVVSHTQTGSAALRQSLPADKVWTLPIGAFDAYATMAAPEQPLADIPADAPVVVLAGLLRPYKGVDTLIRAWQLVHKKVPNAHLIIAGKPMGIHVSEMSVIALRERLNIHLVPRFIDESEYGWLMRRARAVCLPYRNVDMSGVVASALACHTPVVLSRTGGFVEFEGKGALLAAVDSHTEIAAHLVSIMTDTELYERLVSEAKTAVADEFSWHAIAHEYVRRYRSLA